MTKARNLADLLSSDGKVEADDLDVGQVGGRRNLIINGAFKVSQRGDFTSSTSVSGNNTFSVDRFSSLYSGFSSNTVQVIEDTVNSTTINTLKLKAGSTASGYLGLRTGVEVDDFVEGQQYTYSVWVKTNVNGVTSRFNNIKDIGGAGVPDANGSASHNGDGTWQQLKQTFVFKKVTGGTPYIWHAITYANNNAMSLTSSSYIQIAMPQLEVGDVATPFEHRSYGEELALCSRYYHRYVSAGDNEGVMMAMRYTNGNAYGSYPYPVPMRTDAPTFSSSSTTAFLYLYSTSAANVTSFQCTQFSDRVAGINFGAGSASNGQAVQLRGGPSGTWFAFDAEL